MADQVKVTKQANSKAKQSLSGACFGVLIGIALIIGSFVVLFNNEGKTDMSKVGKKAVDLKSESLDNSADGKLVNVTGKIDTQEVLSDDLFVVADKYIVINRIVETYSWKEESTTETDSNDVETTTYTYKKDWNEKVANSSSFYEQAGHSNPTPKYENLRKTVNKAQIGVYDIEIPNIKLPNLKDLKLSQEKILPNIEAKLVNDQYLFVSLNGMTDINNPEIGDTRISYKVFMPDTSVTVFGKLEGKNITNYVDNNNNQLFRIFDGNKDTALKTMHSEYKTSLWLGRVGGFLMMWIGLSLIFGPITFLADKIPFFGKIGKSIIGMVSFVVSLFVTFLVVTISAILHNTLLLIIVGLSVVIAAGIGLYFYLYKKQNNK